MISSSTAPVWAAENPEWWVDTVPVVDLTTIDEDLPYVFERVVSGIMRRDGSIVLADAGANEIRLYDRTGQHLSTFGREGEGPEEFRFISKVFPIGEDSVAVFSSPYKLTILSPELEFVRTQRIQDRLWEPEFFSGHLIATEFGSPLREYDFSEGSKLVRRYDHVVRLDRDGQVTDTIWSGIGGEDYRFVAGERRGSVAPLFWQSLSYSPRGSELVLGASDRMEYRVIAPDGTVRQIVRVPTYDLSVADTLIEAERAARMGEDPPEFWRTVMNEMPAPSSLPAFSELKADSEEFIWAAEPRSAVRMNEPMRWEIFSPEGQWLGSLTTPARFRTLAIGRDRILGVQLDAMDVQHVQVLTLHRDN